MAPSGTRASLHPLHPLRPGKVRRSRPVCNSQSLSVPSYEPERAWRPSGNIATAFTVALVTRDAVQEPSGCEVPEPQRAVVRTRKGLAAVGAHRDRASLGLRVRWRSAEIGW